VGKQLEYQKKPVGRADAQRGQNGHFGKGEKDDLKTRQSVAEQRHTSERTVSRDVQFARAVDTIAKLGDEVRTEILDGDLFDESGWILLNAAKSQWPICVFC